MNEFSSLKSIRSLPRNVARKAFYAAKPRLQQYTAFNRAELQYRARRGKLWHLGQKNHPLNSALLDQCLEYAADVLGDESYAYELAEYCAIHGKWREGWLPESYFHLKIIVPSIGVTKLAREKTLSAYFITDGSLPDIGYFVNGVFFKKNWEVVPSGKMRDMLFADRDRIVFKTNRSLKGLGVYVLGPDDFSEEVIRSLGPGCFQAYIKPHPSVPVFGLPSVSNLRVVTAVDRSGSPSARYCGLRLARLEHTHVMSADMIRVMICMRTGKLQSEGYLGDYSRVSQHPDTKIQFEGTVYPKIGEALDLCTHLHSLMPNFVSVGWDMCLSECGNFKIMEWNQKPGIKAYEAINGPNFADLGWFEPRKV